MAKYGKKLVDHGLVESNFGNISVRVNGGILITKTGVALDEIDENGVILVDLEVSCDADRIASTEVCVHREIYKNTDADAIIHGHCPYSVTGSLLSGEGSFIEPLDSEGKHFLGQIPVVGGFMGSNELAENLSISLQENRGSIVYSHGTFAKGKDLKDAYIVTTQIEHSCRVKYLYDLARK